MPVEPRISVGKKYYSRCQNQIEILSVATEYDEEEKPHFVFTGTIRRTIKGHEIILGSTVRYDAEGRWILSETGKILNLNSIHDLSEEV